MDSLASCFSGRDLMRVQKLQDCVVLLSPWLCAPVRSLLRFVCLVVVVVTMQFEWR
uniref:XPG_I_2 domain-containing protein n=1 Tax=Mesocestoides corti TaxID=53468 RepID=A0A5K3FEX4_MESCO